MRLPWNRPAPDLQAIADASAVRAVAAYKAEQEQARVEMAARVAEVRGELERAQLGMMGVTPAVPNGRRGRVFARDNPWTYAIPHAPSYHPGALVDIRTLRRFAQVYDPARSMINHLKREVEAAPFSIVAKDAKNDSAKVRARIAEAEAWFRRDGGLGGRGFTRSKFEKEIIEELMVIGPAAVYLEPTRGGNLYEAVCIDASTIRPVVDPYGFPDPSRAYEQWIMGIKGRDFSLEEMYWEGLYPRTDSPYPDSPTEYLILTIISAMAADTWNRTWLTTGTEPRRFLGFPPEMTVTQVGEWIDFLNDLYSENIAGRNKLVPFPAGGNQIEPPSRRDQDFQEFELQLIRRCGAVYGVQPSSVGLSQGKEYAVTQERSNDQTSEIGTAILLLWLENAYNYFLERLGFDDLEAKYRTQREETAAEKAERVVKLTGVPVWTPNRGLQELGDDPLPDDQGNVLFVPNTYVPIDLAINPPEPMPATAPGTESGGDAAAQKTPDERRAAELERWEQRALSALTRHGSARCRHDRAVIPEEARSAIYTGLSTCETADQVRALFTAWKGEPVGFPPVYHTSAQAWEREQIARKWRERREQAEREA
jgi:hypothetical protein